MSFPPIVIGYDTTHANITHLPPGQQAAGYTTGPPFIKWTDADWAAHPGALRIDQDFAASDFTADYLDVETGAATNTEAANWYRKALASYHAATRPGQRAPGIYTSANNVTPLVNALIAAGVTSGPRLIVANWNLAQWQALAEVAAASGPYPIVGIQFADPGPYDINVFSSAWLHAVSAKPAPPPAPHGPYPHTADGTHSLAQIAATRGTTAAHLLTMTEQALARVPLAKGTQWWSSNP
jgi:hypothetical protein